MRSHRSVTGLPAALTTSGCLIDECVLEGAPIEFLYREEANPDLERLHGLSDSGWRIRGRIGDTMDEIIDTRPPLFVSLQDLLGANDACAELLDEPSGSAFARDPQSGGFVTVVPLDAGSTEEQAGEQA